MLVTSATPLRAYFYHEGLVRFASSKYNHSEAERGKQTQVLTNTSIGKFRLVEDFLFVKK